MPQALDGSRVQVVGMAMRKPYILGLLDVGPFSGGNSMGEAPAAEKRVIFVAEPRVRGKDRNLVIRDQRCIADCLYSEHRLPRPKVGWTAF